MRSRDELAFILARTLEWVAAHPPTGPLLGEHAPPARRTVCTRGHARTGSGNCLACERDRKRRRRSEGVGW